MICTTCGSKGPLERHHVGRRKYSSITTMLCIPCHFYCTVADVYERQWRPGEPTIARQWAGLMDVWDRFCLCNDLTFAMANEVLFDAEYRGLFRYRPCAAVAKHVEQTMTDTLREQGREILRLLREVTGYEFSGYES